MQKLVLRKLRKLTDSGETNQGKWSDTLSTSHPERGEISTHTAGLQICKKIPQTTLLVLPLWKTIWRYLVRLKLGMP